MHRLFEALRPFMRGVVAHPWAVLLLAAMLSAAGLFFAKDLSVDTDFANLLPPEHPTVQAIDRLRETVGGESYADVAVESPSFEANRAFLEDFSEAVLAYERGGVGGPFFNRVELRRDTEFLEDNALYFATDAELDTLEAYLAEEREAATQAANPFFFDIEEDLEEEEGAEAEEDETAQEMEAAYATIVGREYMVSEDSTVLAARFYPTGAQTNVGFIEEAYAHLDEVATELDPASYHPEMEVVTAGRLLRSASEIRAITGDIISSFGAGVLSVLLAVILYFFYKAVRSRLGGGRPVGRVVLAELARAPVLGLVIAVPLLMSLSWTGGVAGLWLGQLNLMTSTLGLVLFGLGIDFGIHFYARYAEERADGHSLADAIETTFASTGQAIAVGAMTTAAAFYVLTLADFRGFSEFGFLAGTGVLLALVAMTVVLPALLAAFEGIGLLRMGAEGAALGEGGPELAPQSAAAGQRYPGARGVVLGSVAAVIAALALAPSVGFEYDFGSLEPEYEAYEAREARVREATRAGVQRENSRNPAYVLLDDPSEAAAVAAAVRERIAEDATTPTIDRVETLQERFPMTPAGRQARLQRIAEVRQELGEMIQLAGDSDELAEQLDDLRRLRRAAGTEEPIEIEQVPDYLREQFTSKSGELGSFVIIYPSVGLSHGLQSIAFYEDVAAIQANGETYYAASTSLVAAAMLQLMQEEAPWMVSLTFALVALLMFVNFRSFKWAMLALVPLVVGILWMLLLMEIFGVSLNFYNLVVLPAVLGIGNDAGVHLAHRYREEGHGSIRAVLRSTGEHVTMGSLTTMIGFAGLLLSFHPGLRSIGILAILGIGATLLAALLFLPALVQWLEDRGTL